MVYKTDPASMLSKSPDYIATLLEHTPDVLDEMIEANLYGR
jgi:glutamine synthetase adenylyltransferase